jgi:hypothetical protein
LRDYLAAVVGGKQQDTRTATSSPVTLAVLRIRRSMPTQKSQLSACNTISGGHMYLQSVSKQTLVEIEAEMATNN